MESHKADFTPTLFGSLRRGTCLAALTVGWNWGGNTPRITLHSNPGKCVYCCGNCTQISDFGEALDSKARQSRTARHLPGMLKLVNSDCHIRLGLRENISSAQDASGLGSEVSSERMHVASAAGLISKQFTICCNLLRACDKSPDSLTYALLR